MRIPLIYWIFLTSILVVPTASAAEPVARVQTVAGNHIVVQGPAVLQFVPQLPVWIVEDDKGKPGLLLAEGVVTSVVGDRATIDVGDRDQGAVHTGDLVEPRWKAEARLYKGALPTAAPAVSMEPSTDAPLSLQVLSPVTPAPVDGEPDVVPAATMTMQEGIRTLQMAFSSVTPPPRWPQRAGREGWRP